MKKLHFAFILVISFSFMVGFSNAISLEAVMPIINGWSASEASNGVKVVKDGNNYYICNSGNLSNCNKKNASLWVKYEKGMNRSDKYYVCSASSSSCDSISHNEVIYQHHETMEFDGYYICSSSSCYFTDSNTKINKDSGGSSYDTSYYVCQGEKYKCLKNNASYKYSITTDKIFRCNTNASSCYSSNATSTITKKSAPSGGNSSSSSSLSSDIDFSWLVADIQEELAYINKAESYYKKGLDAALADDYKTAITNQAEVVKIYKALYKTNKDYKDVLANSFANLGYYLCLNKNYSQAEQSYQASLDLINDPEVKAEMKSCKGESNNQTYNFNNTTSNNTTSNNTTSNNTTSNNTTSNNTTSNNTTSNNTTSNNTNDGLSKLYNNEYSDEYNRAYEYAYANKITTMPTIEQANMHGYITRAEISKMFSEWALKHGATIDTSKSCRFNDISSVKGDLYDYIIKSCQLGIMGQGIKNFRPYDTISRAEVFTVISRMLRGNTYEGCDPYYSCHESAIARAGIYSDMRESDRVQEFRGNVMMYLMRGDGIGKSNSSYDDSLIKDEEAETLEAYNYFNSIASLAKELRKQIKDQKDLDIKGKIQELKDNLKACEVAKNTLSGMGARNGDNSLFDAVNEYIESINTFLDLYMEFCESMQRVADLHDEAEAYIDLGIKDQALEKLDEARKILDTIEPFKEKLSSLKEDMTNKFDNIKTVSSDFLKKHCNQKYLKEIVESKKS